MGLTVMAVGSTPHVAHAPLSELYQAPGATAADQAALALMWQATWGIFDALLFAGLVIIAFGLTSLGIAMLGTPTFGKGISWFSVVIGVLGIGAGVILLIDPESSIAVVNVFSLILFHLILGWKVYNMSKKSFYYGE